MPWMRIFSVVMYLDIFMANDKEFRISRYEKKDYYCLSKNSIKK